MDWWEIALIGGFVGYFIGVMAGVYFWQKYGDWFHLIMLKRMNKGEEPNYCIRCGGLLKKKED